MSTSILPKLIPSDRGHEDDDEIMQLVNRKGVQGWTPAKPREVFIISKGGNWRSESLAIFTLNFTHKNQRN